MLLSLFPESFGIFITIKAINIKNIKKNNHIRIGLADTLNMSFAILFPCKGFLTLMLKWLSLCSNVSSSSLLSLYIQSGIFKVRPSASQARLVDMVTCLNTTPPSQTFKQVRCDLDTPNLTYKLN